MKKTLYFLTIQLVIYSCVNSSLNSNKGFVECRLERIYDSQPLLPNSDNYTRQIQFYYIVTNKTDSTVFLPFNSDWPLRDDSVFCSRFNVYIDSIKIESFVRTNLAWSGVIQPKDSIIIEVKILEWMLRAMNINEHISIYDFMNRVSISYDHCSADTVYSSFQIPHLVLTNNDSVKVFPRIPNEHTINNID